MTNLISNRNSVDVANCSNPKLNKNSVDCNDCESLVNN